MFIHLHVDNTVIEYVYIEVKVTRDTVYHTKQGGGCNVIETCITNVYH